MQYLNGFSYGATFWNGRTHGFGSASINLVFWYKLLSPCLCNPHEGMSNREVWRYELQLRIREIGLDIYQSLCG